jgi:hypothetical protein
MFKRLLGPTNRKVRLFVGLLLLGMFCFQCVPTGDNAVVNYAKALGTAETQEQKLQHFRDLARKDHVEALKFCLEEYGRTSRNFRCTFIKQERINGKVGPEQEIAVKFREKPYCVAMAWTRNAPLGDRVLYVEGKWDSMMLVRPSNAFARALAPTVKRQPDGEEAMATTLRPANQFGFDRGIRSLIDIYTQAKKAGDLREEVLPVDYEMSDGRKAIVLVRHLPEGKGYPAYETKIYIDKATFLPVMIEGFTSRNEFICRYLYKDIDFKANLTDQDFLPERNDLKTPAS